MWFKTSKEGVWLVVWTVLQALILQHVVCPKKLNKKWLEHVVDRMLKVNTFDYVPFMIEFKVMQTVCDRFFAVNGLLFFM